MLLILVLQSTALSSFFLCAALSCVLYLFIIYAGARGGMVSIILVATIVMALYKGVYWKPYIVILDGANIALPSHQLVAGCAVNFY